MDSWDVFTRQTKVNLRHARKEMFDLPSSKMVLLCADSTLLYVILHFTLPLLARLGEVIV